MECIIAILTGKRTYCCCGRKMNSLLALRELVEVGDVGLVGERILGESEEGGDV